MLRIKLVGRPEKIVEHGGTVITVLESRKAPPLPADLPAPPEAPVRYVVYLDAGQWRKVAGTLKNPQDALIVEGFCFYDAELKMLTVLAQSAVNKLKPATGQSESGLRPEQPAAKVKGN